MCNGIYFLKWFVGWKLQGWMILWWWAFLSAECLSQQETIEREFLQKAFFLKILDCCQEGILTQTISLEGSDGFVSLEPPENPGVISQRQQADEDRATRLASAKTFAAAAEQLLPRRRLAKKSMDWIQWMVVQIVLKSSTCHHVMNYYECWTWHVLFTMSHGTETDGENGEGSFKINKLTIIPSSLFPVCHGSDFSSSWCYVDLAFSLDFPWGFSLPTIFCGSTGGIGPLNACGNG